jgi:hypothetical protein
MQIEMFCSDMGLVVNGMHALLTSSLSMSSSATASCENIFAVPRYTFLCAVDDRNMQGSPALHEYANAPIPLCAAHT